MLSLRPALGLLVAGACALSVPAFAQTKHVRGTVDSLGGDTLTVTEAGGQQVAVKLAPDWQVIAVIPSSLSAVTQGTFIGVATTGPDDHLVAREILVLPSAMKGVGEGHYPWDLEGSRSMMTNATVTGDVTQAGAHELTLSYKGGENKVTVPPDTPIVTLGPGERSMVTPGAKVFITPKAENGSLSASRVLVGKDGLRPPM